MLLVSVFLAAAVHGQEYPSTQPAASELPAVAEYLVQHSDSIAAIWPGFWSGDEAFLLSSREGALLHASWQPPAGYTPLPEAESMFVRDEPLPGASRGRFPGTVEIEGRRVWALPPMGSTLEKRAAFYVHEAFHFHQRRPVEGWTATPEDSIMGLSPEAALDDPSIVEDEAFRRSIELEKNLLLEAAGAPDVAKAREILAEYVGRRAGRLDGREDVAAVERRYERREGTATYVGCRAAFGQRDGEAFLECLSRHLKPSSSSNTVVQVMRWRLYSTGGLLSLLLDRLGVEGWKARVAAGARLDEEIATAVEARLPGD